SLPVPRGPRQRARRRPLPVGDPRRARVGPLDGAVHGHGPGRRNRGGDGERQRRGRRRRAAHPPRRTRSAAVSVLEALADARVIAVVRAADADTAVRTAEALIEGGIRAIELTFTTPGVERALARLRTGVLLGAGTLTTRAQVDAAMDAGASFLVSPGS